MSLPFPGKQSDWNGFTRYDFEVDGKPVLVVAPDKQLPAEAVGLAWRVLRPQAGRRTSRCSSRGFHIVYMSVPNMLGSTQGGGSLERLL